MSVSGGPLKEGFSGMKLPSLIKQLKVVLDQYPDDGQILKEIIQNAEDADAGVVKILYDGRTVTPMFSDIPHLKSLKAPGLCVFNDGLFSDEDWEGIRMLHSSVKEQEPLKVGRFGLGFKSVFHITDVPLIISGKKILFIDPHVFEYDPNRVCFIKNLDNIKEFEESLLSVLKGTFGFSEETLQNGFFQGTIFWFPIRSESTELSENVYDNDKMKDLFKAFKAEAPHMMLFLKSLSKIEVYQKNANLFRKDVPDQNVGLLFTVNITNGNEEDVSCIRHEFASSIRQLKGRLPPEPIEKKYYLQVDTEDFMSEDKPGRKSSTWLVIQHYEGEKISKPFQKLCFDKTISSCPCVGLAVPLEEDQEGHIFCFLPLPLESRSPTGLPLHVHGHFALSQNRRHLKWPTADQKKNRAQTDKAIRWNQRLLLEVFPQTYTSLVQELISYWHRNGRDDMFISRIYHTLPVLSNVTEHWEGLCKAFYKLLFEQRFLYTPNSDGVWICVKDGILLPNSNLISQHTKETLVHVYKTGNKNIVEVPDHIHEALTTYYSDPDNQDATSPSFVTQQGLCDLLRSNDLYAELTRQQKLDLLDFICTDGCFEWLDGVQLLPLADGSFATFGKTEQIFVCGPDDTRIFPGLERQFIMTDRRTETYFHNMALQGIFKIETLTPEGFSLLLKKSVQLAFSSGKAHIAPTTHFNMEWLDSVWQYITENEIDAQKEFPEVPIIPGDTLVDGTTNLHPVSSCFICMDVETVGHMDENLGFALKHLGIIPLSKVPDALRKNPFVLGKIIQYPSQGGLLKVLEEVAQSTSFLEMVSNFNQFALMNEKLSLIESLKNCKALSKLAENVLAKLKLFTRTDSKGEELNTSIDQLYPLEPTQPFPVAYPSVYLRSHSHASSSLCQLLGARQITLVDVIIDTLKLMKGGDKRYTKDNIRTFMFFLLEGQDQYFREAKILQLASDVKFLTTEGGHEGMRAKDLFEPQPDLCKLFLKDDVFPAAEYLEPTWKDGLRKLGLRTINNITEEHLCNIGTNTEKLLDQNKTSEAVAKGQALLAYLKQNIKQLNIKSLKPLRYVKFVPCKLQRTENYPETLKLYAEETNCPLERLEKVWNAKHLYILGSVSLVANDLSESIMKAFNLPFEPPLELVLNHLEQAIEFYKEDAEDKYRTVRTETYKFLSKLKPRTMSQDCKTQLERMKYVWISPEWGFQMAKSVWIKKSKSDIDVRPYRFCLPKILNQIESIILETGGEQSQTPEMLVAVLKEIKEKHDKAKEVKQVLTDDLHDDLRVIFQIVNTLKGLKHKPNGINLPVHQDGGLTSLVLKPVENCTYINAEWLKDQAVTETDTDQDEDTLYFVHRDISEDTALELGVTSLTDRVMDGTEAIDLNYSQTEPLTQRLHNILKGYTSYSVPKEMIQNAEDARASKVKFLYDERQNQDARTSLMNKAMASLQGPAFWVYNDAQFKEDDFKNIQKLGGATKQEDESKIGRYGLGFNSVYNLTDVPSFISGNTIVIFDPHQTYLGKPGLKADLTSIKNRRMLQTMKGQFKPFDGIFGCNIEKREKQGICQGTLFRFPLRTPEQAENSKIADTSYTKAEMKAFLKDIARGAGNLLLFTHHVRSVEVYYLQKDSRVDNPHLLLSVEKNTDGQIISSDVGRMEQHVSPLLHLQNLHKSEVYSRLAVNDYVIENVEIALKTTNDFLESFGLDIQNDRMNWQITWAIRDKTADLFVRSAALRGLIPLATTAVPLRRDKDIFKIGQLSECPAGFYTEGHLFSFLPLPLPPTQFGMHVSAQFALTDDRQHLCEPSEEFSVAGKWNKFLEKDVISRTMLLTLEGLKDITKNDVESYYKLWPNVQQNRDSLDKDYIVKPDIAKCFYKLITEEEHCVFVQDGSNNLSSFNDAIFLAPNLAYNKHIGKLAASIFRRFWNESIVIDLPKDIFNCFLAASLHQALKNHVLDTKTFYEKIFLPNLNLITSHDCQMLTLHALTLCDPDLDHLLKSHRCIPTKPDGDLKRPEELVHPRGKASDLYSESDGTFPIETFCTMEVLERLCSLGMKDDEIPWENFMERLSTVQDIYVHDENEALKRCLNILKYLNEYDSKHTRKRYSLCSDITRDEIRAISFLPALPKPIDWSFTWKADKEKSLLKPEDLFFEDAADIVGCLHEVIDSTSLQGLFAEKEVLKWLGVKEKRAIPASIAKDQLLQISTQILGGVPVNKESTRIIHGIYRHLGSFQDCHQVVSTLKDEKVILHDKTLVCPHQVAFDLAFDLQPYLFKLEYSLGNLYKKLFQSMGVREKFSGIRVKEEIDNVTLTFTGTCMPDKDVRLYIHMITLWMDLSKDEDHLEEHLPQMLLPDSTNYLKPAQTLCLDDCNWIKEDKTMQFVHSSVSREIALKLKVKTKRHANIETLLKPLSVTSFGQTEKITSRLRGILEGYPRDSSIMKELLQNADDAGATELMFIKDFRHHPAERVFDEKWKPLQGPALCVWNNSSFTENDFEGIQALGEGSKSDDPLKTGQYGVGFNAVYHLTDVPSFLTFGPETPETLCILDPNLKYVPWATQTSPGCRFPALGDVQRDYRDVFACYLKDVFDMGQEGTLFRLPLRTQEMAKASDISNVDVPVEGENGITHLLEEFQYEMTEALLFLQNVRKISVHTVTNDGKLLEDFSVTTEMSNEHKTKLKKNKEDLQKRAKTFASEVTTTEIILKTRDGDGKEQEWLVVHQSGFSNYNSVPDILKDCMGDGRIGMLPRGGVAIPITETADFNGKVFCILPLRITTGLPIHINGHFALDHEARGNLWHGPHPYRTQWNETIITHIVVPAYIKALEKLTTILFESTQLNYESVFLSLNTYNNLFPLISKCSDDYWKLLSRSIYEHIVHQNSQLFPVVVPKEGMFSDLPVRKSPVSVRIEWVTPSKELHSYFNNIPYGKKTAESDHRLVEILKDLGMRIIDMPLAIYCQFQETGLEGMVACTSPSIVINFLKTHCSNNERKCQIGNLPIDIKLTALKDTYALIVLTKYCKSAMDSTFATEMDGLPLLLTQDSKLRCFNSHFPAIVTYLQQLVKDSPEQAMHQRLVYTYTSLLDETETIKRLDICTFSTILPRSMGHLNSSTPVVWDHQDRPFPPWILLVWDFLQDEIDRVTKKKRPDVDTINLELSSLQTWCILPVVVKKGRQIAHYLYPLREAKKILNLKGDINMSAFSQIAVPQLDADIFQNKESLCLAQALVANLSNPIATLKAVADASTKGANIDMNSGRSVLKYFCNYLSNLEEKKSETVPLLKGLPIFEDMSGSLTNIQLSNIFGISKYEDIPQEGMETWSVGLDMSLLKCSDMNKKLFVLLGIRIMAPEELYTSFILKKFGSLPSPARSVHLKYVRDHLLRNDSAQLKITECLKSLFFIEDKNGLLHRACDYFCKEQTLFAKFCSEDKFPPPPYDNEEWKNFLKIAGIVTEVSQEHFISFAKLVEKESESPLTKGTKEKSMLLVQHLFEHRRDLKTGGILSYVKDIKFVVPHTVEKQKQEIICDIHPQFQQGKLISYSGAVASSHFEYVWTSCAMFESYADPDYYKFKHNQRERKEIAKLLQVQKEPNIEAIVRHAENICKSLEKKQLESPFKPGSCLHTFLITVMGSIYRQLLEKLKKNDETSKMKLKSIPLIFLPEAGLFVKAEDIVLETTSQNVIKGYMYKAPVHFGPYYELFLLLGAAKMVTSNHYAHILQTMSTKTGDTKLNPNELETVQKTTDLLFKCLKEEVKQKESSLTLPHLYLLDKDLKLAKSTQLVVADNEEIQKRVKSLNLRYFVGFRKLKISATNEQEVFHDLPSKYRPQILTEAIQETISEECRQCARKGPVSDKYKTHISHQEFLIGVIRLINDPRRLNRMKALEDTDLREIEDKIVNLDVKEVEGLNTELSYNGQHVKGSEHTQVCFLDTSKDHLSVYLNGSAKKSSLNKIVLTKCLAEAINKLTGCHLTTNITFLVNILDCSVDKIKKLLDIMMIPASSYISSHAEETVFPKPGTYIPDEYHWMLDNSFSKFEENEYVGLEIYDPLTDDALHGKEETLPSCQKGPVYIYAKVKNIVEEGRLAIHARYLIDVGEDEAKEVSALDLYKFCRIERSKSQEVAIYTRSPNDSGADTKEDQKETPPTDDTPLDMDSVLKEIREILKEAWKMTDKKHREKIKKRLLFKWHPDKNKGNTEFCTKVFQRIQNYIEMLDKGKNIDENTGSDTGPKTKRSGFDEWFYEEMKRRSRQHKDDYEHHRSSYFNFEDFFSRSGDYTSRGHKSAREDPHPQPEVAKRWMMQARDDLKVARTTLQMGSAYNWSCFQCYMACEKAVKALMYNQDAKDGEKYQTEDLCTLVYRVKETQIKKLIRDLLTIVQNANKMQYPSKMDFPKIPAETFTQQNAEASCDIADHVLQKAYEVIG